MKTARSWAKMSFVLFIGAVNALAAEWFVATNGNDAAAGTNWATAKLTIQAGVDAASDGDTVWVSNGVYSTGGGRAVVGTRPNRVAIDKAVTVIGVNGPEETIIVGGGMRGAYVTNGATLSGFTLTNGTTASADGCSYTDGVNNRGGGAYCESNAMLTNCVLTGNWACYAGGGVNGGILNNCTLTNNGAGCWGAGACDSILNDCRLLANHCDNNGGALLHCEAFRCELIGNRASAGGGADRSTLEHCLLADNYGGSMGGGALSCTLSWCRVTGNLSKVDGGGGANLCTLYDCLLDGNRAESIPGMGDEPSGGGAKDSTLVNCTVVGNLAFWGGGVRGGSLVNCIVYGNTATNNPNWQDGAFTNSCTTPDPGGTGNLTSDPQFVDAGAGNYRLGTNSPCINGGDNDRVQGEEDLDGNPRIAFGAEIGVVDMGAYEFLSKVRYVATNGSDVAAGTNWPTAKQTIQAAIDAADLGDMAMVSNGVYATGGRVVHGALTNRVVLDKPIFVLGVAGSGATVIQGAWDPLSTNGNAAVRCAYVGSNAMLSGYTLTHVAARMSGDAALEQRGGGAWCEASGALCNCLLIGNAAAVDGGGLAGGTANNCTIAGNTAGSSGGGSAGGTLNNCIVYGNTAPSGANYSGGTFDHGCTTPDPGGTGNVTGDPQFVDAGAGNYRLMPASPCIDAGDNGLVQWDEDLDGNQRIVYGMVDMGAYEAQLAGTGTWFGAITNGLTNDTDCATGDGVPNLLKYATGSSPRVSDDVMLVEWVLNNGVPTLVFNRNPNATDVTLIVQGADEMSDGAAWRGLATNRNGSWGGAANVSESGTGIPVVCTVVDPVALLTNRFLRLKVTRP